MVLEEGTRERFPASYLSRKPPEASSRMPRPQRRPTTPGASTPLPPLLASRTKPLGSAWKGPTLEPTDYIFSSLRLTLP